MKKRRKFKQKCCPMSIALIGLGCGILLVLLFCSLRIFLLVLSLALIITGCCLCK